jgi:hypothetical protein
VFQHSKDEESMEQRLMYIDDHIPECKADAKVRLGLEGFEAATLLSASRSFVD